MARPFKYMLSYFYNNVFDDTGWSKALDVIGGIWDFTNHAITLQLQEFPGAVCLNIWDPVYNLTLVVIPRSRASSPVCSSPFWSRGTTLA